METSHNAYIESYLTGVYDIDLYLIKFLTVRSVKNLSIVSKSIYKILTVSPIFKQLVELKDFKSYERLRYSVEHGYFKIIKIFNRSQLISADDIIELISEASKFGQLNVLICLLKLVDDIKLNNAIMYASSNGHIAVVRYLISIGADLTVGNNRAVRYASRNGHLDVVKYLVSVGANPTDDNNYAVQYASQNGHLDVVRYLVSVGADCTARDNCAILYASRNGHLDVVQYLVSVGADAISIYIPNILII